MTTVASLFAGCGGSSLGYRAAGFRVSYACEFNPKAADTYELNAPDDFRVDRRSVKEVRGQQILEACDGDLDVLDGSPPCQPFSTMGKRAGSADERDMFPEYIRLVGEARPRAFVCENVPGLKSHPRYLAWILSSLREAGYAARAKILDASMLGVPQKRHRLVIVGFRSDLAIDPTSGFPRPRPERLTIRDAIPGTRHLVRPFRGATKADHLIYRVDHSIPADLPSPTVTRAGISGKSNEIPFAGGFVEMDDGSLRPLAADDARALMGFPAEFRFPEEHSEGERWQMLGNAVPPPMARTWAESVRRTLASAR
jgi:DNA (cytosine-5)-methyltransferase 1